jgi:hypothetical protein
MELDDVQLLTVRGRTKGVSDRLKALAARAEESGAIEFGRFHTWRSP